MDGIHTDRQHALMMESFLSAMEKNFEIIGVEMPYSHYGARGFIDVVLRSRCQVASRWEWLVCELKPSLHDVGEAIRQVKRAEACFEKARPELFGSEPYSVTYPLVLLSTEDNLQACFRHMRILSSTSVLFFHAIPEMTANIAGRFEIAKAILAARDANHHWQKQTASH